MPETVPADSASSAPQPFLPEALTDRLTDFLARVSINGALSYVSRSGKAWLGGDEKSFSAEANLADLFLAEDRPLLQEALLNLIAGQRREFAARLLRNGSEPVWVVCRVMPLIEHQGQGERVFAAWDISRFKHAEEKLEQVSRFDVLTGLANRGMLSVRLTELIRLCEPSASMFTIVHLDLDGFKKVNEAFSHAVGDELLAQAGARLKSVLREVDLAARIGGDEFILVFPGTADAASAEQLVRKVLHALQKPFQVEDTTLYLSASMGVAFYPLHGTEESQLLHHVDTALHKAKQAGRGQYQIYEPEGAGDSRKLIHLEKMMHDAIENGEFELYYQPLFLSGDPVIAGVEALMRWKRPGYEEMSPTEFIPLAEENGLINFLGKWSLRMACHQVAQWNTMWRSRLLASVNISPRQFLADDVVSMVQGCLEESGLAPDCLSLEITEGTLMLDAEMALRLLGRIRAGGVRVSVDDFGTGYSSLAYLKRFPLSSLKVDRSFVRDLSTDANDRAIISMIVGLARELDLKVVAEGVENQTQLAFLREKGCDLVQGFLYCRPLTAKELEQRVENGEWQVLH